MVTICLVMMLGFAALTVDVGAIYNARADLQRTADSASLAAAALLSEFESGDPVSQARQAALQYVQQNWVMGRSIDLDPGSDVTFLRAHYNAGANTFSFTETTTLPDAVRVNVGLSDDSPNGSMVLFFAHVFGRSTTNVTASATAMMVPRDIAIAADLSASHTDDSELKNYQLTDINLWDVWAALPGGFGEANSVWDPSEIPPEWIDGEGHVAQAAGPAWGFMKRLGYGSEVSGSYDPVADDGLAYLPYRTSWTNAELTGQLTAQGYTAAEVNAIMTNGGADSSTIYPNRVAVAMGLAVWNSGMPGGRWSQVGLPPGNGNTTITAAEMVWTETLMGRSPSASAAIFNDYVKNYVMQTSTAMYEANSAFRYRYGVKTFVNYLLEDRPQHDQTPELAETPTQPMQAVKDGVQHMMDILVALDTQDQVSLEVYGTTGRHEVDLTSDFSRISNRLHEMQAAHYDRYTNIGAGLERAIEELSSSRARSGTRKIIVLYTDGIANVNESGVVDYAGAKAYALTMAQEAKDRGFRIYAVSVGVEPDIAFMNQIAAIGDGEHFHAEGSIEEYSAQLDAIFNALGSRRTVQLVQ